MILAPLAGINDIAFRRLCREHGATLVYTGMVNANALIRGNKATLRLAEVCQEERPVCIQLFGSNTETLVKAAKMLDCDQIDINMGCPDRNVIRQGAGAALLRRPSKVHEIVSNVKKAIKIPLSVKIRSGIEKHDLGDTLKIASTIQDAGADSLTVHPRTVKQGYSGTADWSVIKKVKEELIIPVIGNGDIDSYETAIERLKVCDDVMIGRAAMGNPFIFSRVEPDSRQRKEIFLRYLDHCNIYGIDKVSYLRMQAQFFMKGFEGAADLRRRVGKAETIEQLKVMADEITR